MRDIILIGGGAGAVAAAVRASQLGSKVTVVEQEELGGICMNRGCIPTKILLHSAFLYHTVQNAGAFAIRVEEPTLDLESLAKKKNDLVKYLRIGTDFLLKSKGIEVIRGRAFFVNPHCIMVNGKILEAKTFIIATGSRLGRPSIKGIEQEGVISSDEAIEMIAPPKSIAVLGGGPLEVEFALYFGLIGSKVTLIEKAPRILSSEEGEISSRMTLALKEKGITVIRGSQVHAIKRKKGGLVLEVSSEKKGQEVILSDFVLTMSRAPNLESLELEKAEVRWDERGILVDEELRTNRAHIYAIGDVTGEPMFSYRASAQGIAAAENIHGLHIKVNPMAIPRAYYTKPEIGAVGLTEREAKADGIPTRVGFTPYSLNSRAMIELDTSGIIKLISDSRNGKILGVHMIGPYATELIGQATIAIQLNAMDEDLARTIVPHPSFSESLPEVAREALDRSIYMPSR